MSSPREPVLSRFNDGTQPTHLWPLGIATAHEGNYCPPQHPAGPLTGCHSHGTQQLNGNPPPDIFTACNHDMMRDPSPGQGGAYAPSSAGAETNRFGAGGAFGQPINTVPYGIQPKKQVRTTQVCYACRDRNAECDEGRPSRKYCLENGQPCIYREVQPQKPDCTAQILLNEMTDVKDTVTRGVSVLKGATDALHQQVAASHHGYCSGKPHQADTGPSATPSAALEKEVKSTQWIGQVVNHGEARMPIPLYTNERTRCQLIVGITSFEEDGEGSGASPKTIGDVSELPKLIERTSSAPELLRWPSIQKLLSQAPTPHNGDYVMDLEEKRGPLRLHGRGEGADPGDDGQPSVKSEEQVFSPSSFSREVVAYRV